MFVCSCTCFYLRTNGNVLSSCCVVKKKMRVAKKKPADR